MNRLVFFFRLKFNFELLDSFRYVEHMELEVLEATVRANSSLQDMVMSKARELYEYGLRAEKQGKWDAALKFYKASVKEDPSFRASLNNLGVLYARAKRPELAIGFFKRTLELGEDEIVYFNLGSECFRLDRLDEGRHFLKKALKFQPRMLKAHILLAYLYEKSKQQEKAEIYFENALKIDPVNRPAALGLVVSLTDRGEHEQALSRIERYLERRPKDESLLNMKAGLLLKLNRHKESLEQFSELVTSSKGYTSFTDHLNAARKEKDKEYAAVFDGIDGKIGERTKKLRAKIRKRKEIVEQAQGGTDRVDKEDLKDMMDLSFLHLFNGDTDKALRFLMQAQKMGQQQGPED